MITNYCKTINEKKEVLTFRLTLLLHGYERMICFENFYTNLVDINVFFSLHCDYAELVRNYHVSLY